MLYRSSKPVHFVHIRTQPDLADFDRGVFTTYQTNTVA